jgi:hypothetical protein
MARRNFQAGDCSWSLVQPKQTFRTGAVTCLATPLHVHSFRTEINTATGREILEYKPRANGRSLESRAGTFLTAAALLPASANEILFAHGPFIFLPHHTKEQLTHHMSCILIGRRCWSFASIMFHEPSLSKQSKGSANREVPAPELLTVGQSMEKSCWHCSAQGHFVPHLAAISCTIVHMSRTSTCCVTLDAVQGCTTKQLRPCPHICCPGGTVHRFLLRSAVGNSLCTNLVLRILLTDVAQQQAAS